VQKITLVPRKIKSTKPAATRAAPNRLSAGVSLRPTVGAFSAPPGPVAVFRGLFLKGGEGEKRKGGRREEWEMRRG